MIFEAWNLRVFCARETFHSRLAARLLAQLLVGFGTDAVHKLVRGNVERGVLSSEGCIPKHRQRPSNLCVVALLDGGIVFRIRSAVLFIDILDTCGKVETNLILAPPLVRV